MVILTASNEAEIDAAFATLLQHERCRSVPIPSLTFGAINL
jgi:hypothetical protein